MKCVLAELYNIANELDRRGLYVEADTLDSIIKTAVQKIKPPRPKTDIVYPLKDIDTLKEKAEDIPQMIANIEKAIHERISKVPMSDSARTETMYLMRKKTELTKELEEIQSFLKNPVYEWGYDKTMRESEAIEEYEQNPDPFDRMQEEGRRKSLGLTEEEYRQLLQKEREESQRKMEEEVASGFWDEQWKELRKQQIEDAATIPNFDPEAAVILPDGRVKQYE